MAASKSIALAQFVEEAAAIIIAHCHQCQSTCWSTLKALGRPNAAVCLLAVPFDALCCWCVCCACCKTIAGAATRTFSRACGSILHIGRCSDARTLGRCSIILRAALNVSFRIATQFHPKTEARKYITPQSQNSTLEASQWWGCAPTRRFS